MPKYKLPISERFKTKYNISDTGCWEWNGALRADGYGILKINGRCDGAHRYSYELANGEIQNGLCVLHRCDNPPCVNPDHLFLGTKKDNTLDAIQKGRLLTAVCPSVGRYKSGCRCDGCVSAMREKWNRTKRNKN